MSSEKLISTLILANYRPSTLPNALESALGQNYQCHEVVVVQDSDNMHVRDIIARYEQRDQRVKYFKNPNPGNIAKASNYGIALSHGTYIAILDDDDEWTTPSKLSAQISCLERHRTLMGIGGNVIVINEHRKEVTRYKKPSKNDAIRRVALRANPIANSTAVFRRMAWDLVGGYDESLDAFHDWDFWLKAGERGELSNLDQYLLRYQLWQGGSSWQRLRANAKASREIVRRHRKNYPGGVSAMIMTYLYTIYAHTPPVIGSRLYLTLSTAKKRWLSR